MRVSILAVILALGLAGCAGSQSQMKKSSDEAPAPAETVRPMAATPAPTATPAPLPTKAPTPKPTVKPTAKPAPTRR